MPRDITNNLPPAVARHLTACNGHDIDAWMATFAPDALVNDVQREFAGAEAIRAFATKEIFGDRVTFTPLRAVDRHGDITVHARIDGTYDKTGLPDRLILSLYFSLRDERITQLIIITTEHWPEHDRALPVPHICGRVRGQARAGDRRHARHRRGGRSPLPAAAPASSQPRGRRPRTPWTASGSSRPTSEPPRASRPLSVGWQPTGAGSTSWSATAAAWKPNPAGSKSLSDADWQAIIDLNLVGPARLDRAFVPGMIERGSGVVIHIGSVSARLPIAANSTLVYAAAKAGLATYSKGLAKAVAPHGVRVTMISPGFIETSGAQGMIADIVPQHGRERSGGAPADRRHVGRHPGRAARPAGGGRRTGRFLGVRARRLRQRRELCAERRDHPNRLIASLPAEGR